MKTMDNKLVWGLFLVAGGTFFLLQNVGLFQGLGALFTVAAFGIAGFVFLYMFVTDFDQRWWAAIPSMALLGLAGTIFLGEFGFGPLEDISGTFFLASIGTGFALVFLVKPRYWWAIIPAGSLFTLAAVAGADEVSRGRLDGGGLFFLGLGLTFLVLVLLPKEVDSDLRWAYIPAGALIAMGVLIGTPLVAWIGSLWPAALILGGLYLLTRSRKITAR